LAGEIGFQQYQQYQLFKQWVALKKYCNDSDIRLIGDIPIFVALDSAEVWANQEMYYLDENGQPTIVAGVPPDYFSKTGQLWGNPLYRWDEMKRDGYRWWLSRFRATGRLVDIIRLDHFRGFEKYWAIPGKDKTAKNGQWLPGPGAEFFEVLRQEFGELPIIAEDLGIITPEVEALRDRFGLPGMRVLQFAFSGDRKRIFTYRISMCRTVSFIPAHMITQLLWAGSAARILRKPHRLLKTEKKKRNEL